MLASQTTILESLTYFTTLMLFGFVILATARMRHETLILACMPPVFVAIVVGFVMAIYAWDRFGLPLVLAALVPPWPMARQLGRRYSARDLLITIFLAWALGMVFALLAFQFPDAA